MKQRHLFFLFLAMVVFPLRGISQFVVEDFQTVNLGDKVQISWVLKQGSICNGIKLFRGTDTLNLNQIDEIVGVCGSENEERFYELFDENPISGGLNYYRLQFGASLNSEFAAQEFYRLSEQNFLAYPNPAENNLIIRYFSVSNDAIPIFIYDVGGKFKTSVTGKNNYAELNTANLDAGTYFFQMLLDGKDITGKFLVN